ncbi:MAG: hypothetical protein MUQ27_06435, partial [Acidimicrobiia bacterium]|nr:hypothetical protein [Acidimicrobiia bacterium]
MTPAHLELLSRLALADEVTLRAVTGGSPFESEPLDAVTHSLVIIAAVVALDPDGPSYHAAIDAALAAGAEDDAINDV